MSADAQPWIQWSWVRSHPGELWHDVAQHLSLTLIAVALGLLISVPLALVVWRWRRWETPIYGIEGVLFAIPSLALFAFLIPITGLSRTTAEIGLVSYTLLILTRNIATGLREVPPEVRDAARGLGYSPARQLLRVELPLAVPTIIAGVRIAVVTTIGLVTIASLIGAGGGLGQLIQQGQQNDFKTQVVLGCVLSVLLAAVLDAVLVLLQRLITPWATRGAGT